MRRRERRLAFVITCEHAGNRIPARYRECFTGQHEALESHHGYDRGALPMARDLAGAFGAPLFYSTVSRLLVDLNRSPGHRRLHAEAVRKLPATVRREIVADYYAPMRGEAERWIAKAVAAGQRVIHVSSHSFTPVLDGDVRTADVGLLYDPGRAGEAALCRTWQATLLAALPHLRVRRNYPYAGKSDGFAAFLRKRYAERDYIGMELEINQAIVLEGGPGWQRLRRSIVASLAEASSRLFPRHAVKDEDGHQHRKAADEESRKNGRRE
ncbi:MAG TPA: N-formylglutamate amidohydrolase [Rhodocyclaceae bacterium]